VTLPAVPPISIAQIAAEFGLAATAIFPTAFYGKGGAPASGVLSFFDFLGRSAGTPTGLVDIFTTSCDAIAFGAGTANANYVLNASGAGSGSGVTGWTWLLSGTAAAYEVFATLTSGTLSSGTTGSWLPLNVTRSWSRTRTGIGVSSAQVALQIRRVSDGLVLDNAQIVLNATVET
jgi:hypothetical protein